MLWHPQSFQSGDVKQLGHFKHQNHKIIMKLKPTVEMVCLQLIFLKAFFTIRHLKRGKKWKIDGIEAM